MVSLCAAEARYRLTRLASIIVLPFALAACASDNGKDFSQTDLPPGQVATVTGHHLVITKVDGVRNVPAFGTVVNRLTGEEKINTVRLPQGVHVIDVSYVSGPKEVTLQPVRVKLSPYRDYALDLKDGRVTFAEMFGAQARNIPLYEKALSTSDGSNAPTPAPIVINVIPRYPAPPAAAAPGWQTSATPGATNYAEWEKARANDPVAAGGN